MEKPIKLYHYTTVEKAIQYILPSSELRMGAIENLNDPLENLLHYIEINSLINSDRNSDMFDFLIATYIRNESKILSFSIDKKIENNIIYGYAFPRMWAQYGGNNTGVCLEIDYETFIDENSDVLKNKNYIYHDNVKYNFIASKRIPKQMFGVKAGTSHKSLSSEEFWDSEKIKDKFISDFFFTKNLDWQDESEYRFLKYSNEPVNLSIKKSLSNIYLGVYFSKFYLPSIKDLVLNNMIKSLSIDLNGGYRDY